MCESIKTLFKKKPLDKGIYGTMFFPFSFDLCIFIDFPCTFFPGFNIRTYFQSRIHYDGVAISNFLRYITRCACKSYTLLRKIMSERE